MFEVEMDGTKLSGQVRSGLLRAAPRTLFEFVKDLGGGVYTQYFPDGDFKQGIHVWSRPGLIDLLQDPPDGEFTDTALSLFVVMVRLALPGVFIGERQRGQFIAQYLPGTKAAVFTITDRSSGGIVFTLVVKFS